MISMTLAEAAAAMGSSCSSDRRFVGVGIDSRSLDPDQLFFAIVGERFDGHSFVGAALAAGAAAAVVMPGRISADVNPESLIEVSDTRRALGDLARCWRRMSGVRVAGITGSNGKTTVKEMLAAIAGVSHRVLATRGNLNNEIGVPLTLFGIDADVEIAVVEMGTSGPGEIAYLASIAEPDVALVNNCGAAHLQRLGSVEGVATEKSAIYGPLPADGVAVVNADDAQAARCLAAAADHSVLTFSAAGAPADLRAVGVRTRPDGGSVVRAELDDGTFELEVPLAGPHNVSNALAAAAVALALGIGVDDIARGLARVQPAAGRLERRHGPGGSVIVDDTYNANPDSLAAALNTVATMGSERWLVLGDMGELGGGARARHREAGAAASAAGIARLFTLGPLARLAGDTFDGPSEHFDSHESLLARLRERLEGSEVVLVKGSRSARLEHVVGPLTRERATC